MPGDQSACEAATLCRQLGHLAEQAAGPAPPTPAVLAAQLRKLHQAAEGLRQQSMRQVEAGRRKDEFLALLAHELRNPLTPLRNAMQLLRLEGSDAATIAWVSEVGERQIRQLARLVDDLLDTSRLSSGKIRLSREPCDLTQVIQAVMSDYASAIEGAGLKPELELHDQPLWVEGDPLRLAQAVGNLLHNAIKFSSAGGRVTVRLTEDPAAKRAVVAVADNGIGIEPDLLSHIFETFTQGDRSLNRSFGGLGLGLALVKGLIELHGGQVRAASDGPGKGTEVSFWLPLCARPTAAAPPPASRPVAGTRTLRVVVIDDNADAADTLAVLLRFWGHEVVTALSGQAGLEAVQRNRPDVVLCDLGLPGMDGFSVARTLRRDATTAAIYLLAITGFGQDEDRRRAQEAGFDGLLAKPIDMADLQRALARLVPQLTAV
jgi:signal transduction histidine kinase/ActR/RegA family two-component response regulator